MHRKCYMFFSSKELQTIFTNRYEYYNIRIIVSREWSYSIRNDFLFFLINHKKIEVKKGADVCSKLNNMNKWQKNYDVFLLLAGTIKKVVGPKRQ